MYKRNGSAWSKHFDFLIIDEISLQIALILAVMIRTHRFAYHSDLYSSLGFMLILIDMLVIDLRNSMHNVISRGYFVETVETVKHCFVVFAIATVYMFATQSGKEYSRIVLFLTFLFHVLIGYCTRLIWKYVIRHQPFEDDNKNNMLVVVSPETAKSILDRLNSKILTGYKIVGVVLTQSSDLKMVGGFPVVADIDSAADYIVREWVDSVYIDVPLSDEKVIKLMDDCALMAVPTHYHVPNMSRNGVKRFAEKIGGTTVLTTSMSYMTPVQAAIKRMFDIVAGLIGSLIALLLIAILGPVIKRRSPGPVLFVQERVGQNGKRIKIYKIRSMYMDAEERKKELMEQNRVKDGMMFKLSFDPRIIGNEILPDGTMKTGIGEFIRKYSLDEFPQFFGVLKGDMSTVGTRPPTVDEYNRYQYHHRARLAIKPGITGMWQVNGRSEITDFEEVVKLDTEYITNWNFGLDLKIMLKTIIVIFTGNGAM